MAEETTDLSRKTLAALQVELIAAIDKQDLVGGGQFTVDSFVAEFLCARMSELARETKEIMLEKHRTKHRPEYN